MALYLVAAQHRADSPFNLLEDHTQVWRDLTDFDDELRAAGALVFSRGLEEPDAAVAFRAHADGSVARRTGPYAPTTLAGMWIIDCPEQDAERWAQRCAAAHRCDVELRPFQPHVSDQLKELP
jgi:hypothetical protein